MAITPRTAPADAKSPLLQLWSGGHEIWNGTNYFYDARDRLDRTHWVLQYTLGGTAFVEDVRRPGRRLVPPGTAFSRVIPGPFKYGYEPGGETPYQLVFLSIGGPAAFAWQRRIHADFGSVLEFGVTTALPRQMMELATAYQSGRLPDAYQVSAQLYQIVMTVYSLLRERRVEQRPRVASAIELIRTQGHDPGFGVETLATRLDCSREHLAREFRAATGQTVGRALANHRLRLATRLLRESDRKLERIARESGFSNANYFCRVFRQSTGVSPGEFRARPWLTAGVDATGPF